MGRTNSRAVSPVFLSHGYSQDRFLGDSPPRGLNGIRTNTPYTSGCQVSGLPRQGILVCSYTNPHLKLGFPSVLFSVSACKIKSYQNALLLFAGSISSLCLCLIQQRSSTSGILFGCFRKSNCEVSYVVLIVV